MFFPDLVKHDYVAPQATGRLSVGLGASPLKLRAAANAAAWSLDHIRSMTVPIGHVLPSGIPILCLAPATPGAGGVPPQRRGARRLGAVGHPDAKPLAYMTRIRPARGAPLPLFYLGLGRF